MQILNLWTTKAILMTSFVLWKYFSTWRIVFYPDYPWAEVLVHHSHLGEVLSRTHPKPAASGAQTIVRPPRWCCWWPRSKESACNAGDLGLIPGLGRSLKGNDSFTPVIFPGEFHGQRSPVCRPWGPKEWDTTEINTFTTFTRAYTPRKHIITPTEVRGVCGQHSPSLATTK